MVENTHGSGRRAFGDLTNILCKRPALSDPENSTGGIKIRRIEKDTMTKKEFDENAMNSSRGKGIVFGHLFDGVAKGNFERPSIFRHTKVQHMAAKAAGLLSKEVSDLRDRCPSVDSFDFSDKEQDSSLDSEGEYDEDDETGGELPGHFSNSEVANDGECLTQEEIVGSSGNQKPLSSLDFTTGGDLLSSSVQHASMRTGGLEEAVSTKSCACSFCLKAAFMLADLLYQDARSRLSVSKKSIKFARSLEAKKSKGNEYAANVAGYDPKQAVGLEFELSQQQRSLFLYTENALVRESTQLHSSFVKLKELRENYKTDLGTISNSSLGK
ncbi:hypothetical protein SETIT_1G323300v2 [Setaria italica]|uniref:Uncharacterized protein n=2 Tax=Setaria italica TaxID=4555 RepID=A0A368PTU9_SETIT|nr:uncharacterized protein LOC101780442 [Setaria italica]RCV08400.1 hypothetical protein SETIT_1G323300v2 [Setaria italica]RCV08401.1 hypothetical protein SETIT_1G323300v2 [Setaria italica]